MLQSLSKSISVSLQKLGRKPKAVKNMRRLITLNERKLQPKIDEWMKLIIKDIQRGLSKLKSKNSKVADWKHIKEQGNLILKPVILAILGEGGKAVVDRKIMKQDRFDEIGTSAVKWAEKHTAALVVEITAETQAAIKAFIVDAVKKGKSIPVIAKQLRPLVGLTTRQIMAVANYEEWLIVNRPEYTVKVIREMAEVKARRLHRFRAEMIARTETANSLSEGIRQGYKQMGIKQLQFVAGPGSCDDCADLDTQIFPIAEAEGVIAVHPGCRCTFIAA